MRASAAERGSSNSLDRLLAIFVWSIGERRKRDVNLSTTGTKELTPTNHPHSRRPAPQTWTLSTLPMNDHRGAARVLPSPPSRQPPGGPTVVLGHKVRDSMRR